VGGAERAEGRVQLLVALIVALWPPVPVGKPEKAVEFQVKSSSNRDGYKVGKASFTQITVWGKLSESGGTGKLILGTNIQVLDDHGGPL
jgi:hypothetical protein